MKQNKYDEADFYSAYEQMPRSVGGLASAGEWPVLRALLPELRGKRVLDLGCGFGWHCRYAREVGAQSTVGVDLSENMLRKAQEMTNDPNVSYVRAAIEDVRFADASFDVAISSLALHYVGAFEAVCANVFRMLSPGGRFLFSVEHPIFTARAEQDWYTDDAGTRLHWPVDDYQTEGLRDTSFLTDHVIKYHRTLSTYLNTMIETGFRIAAVKEPLPSEELLRSVPDMRDELRRPMFLIVSAEKPG